MSNLTCSLCKKSFKTLGNLTRHQNTAKYCLKLRDDKQERVTFTFSCNHCDKVYSQKHSLQKHLKECIDRKFFEKNEEHRVEIGELKSELKQKDAKISALEKELRREKMKKKRLVNEKSEVVGQLREKIGEVKTYEKVGTSKTTNNTYIHPKLVNVPIANIRPLTIETVQDVITDGGYTYDMFQQGELGLVRFIIGVITLEPESDASSASRSATGAVALIERNYACTDPSRNKFHRLLESKKWTKDDGAMFLGNILDELKEPAERYYLQMVKASKDAAGDPGMREIYNMMLDAVKPVYFGISSSGDRRAKLFENLRSKIRVDTSV